MVPGWLDDLEGEVLRCLAHRGSMSVSELADALAVSETCAASYAILLASARRLAIERVALLPKAPASVRTPRAA